MKKYYFVFLMLFFVVMSACRTTTTTTTSTTASTAGTTATTASTVTSASTATSATTAAPIDCSTQGVTYDTIHGQFCVESSFKNNSDAVLRIGVDNDDWGNAIVAEWNAAHPDMAGKVEYVNNGSQGAAANMVTQGSTAPDVVFVIGGEVPASQQAMMEFPSQLGDIVTANGFASDNATINKSKVIYAPMTYDGMAFSWNKTMLDSLGIDTTTDSNHDGLPDAFDTWEKIFALGDAWYNADARPTYNGHTINKVFPFSLTEVWSGYSSVTAGGWEIFSTGDATKPGFNDPKFLAGLEFLQDASTHHMSVESDEITDTPGASMTNSFWDTYLSDQTSPFSLVGTWMNVNGQETANNVDFKFSVMPTYKGIELTPFVKTKGFVINASTSYPLASAELLRVIYSKEGFQTMSDHTTYIPAVIPGSAMLSNLTDQNKIEMAAAFAKNYVEPTITFPNNPTAPAMNVYYNINIQEYYQQVWDGDMTPSDAQATIVGLADAYIAENNVAPNS